VLAGTVQARTADTIAEVTGLGRLWVGSVLLAAATSLPEPATDVSAVRMSAADLAAGDLFGSSLADMLILAAIGYLRRGGPVFRATTPNHAVTACFAIVLNAAAGIFVLTATDPTGWPVGAESVLLALGFLAGMRLVYIHRADGGPEGPVVLATGDTLPHSDLRTPVRRFGLATLVVLATAPAFAWSAKRIAELTGLGTTFVGT